MWAGAPAIAALLPATARSPDDSFSFAHGNNLIRLHPRYGFDGPAQPADRQVRRKLRTQAEMQTDVVHRVETGLAHHLLRLLLASVPGDDSGANCATVAPRPHKFHL